MLSRVLNKVLSPLDLKLIPKKNDSLVYQHRYSSYGDYRGTQIHWNKAKIGQVWADERTLEAIATDIERRGLKTGICHGARNGFEVEWLARRLQASPSLSNPLQASVIGTDISDTALQFPNMVVHDFHQPRSEWREAFDFVYTNSLDQAFDPAKALSTWTDQLTENGCIYIEHTMQHSAAGASEMDPFGAHPMVMPYLFFKWGRGKYELADIIELEANGKGHVWVFVIRRA